MPFRLLFPKRSPGNPRCIPVWPDLRYWRMARTSGVPTEGSLPWIGLRVPIPSFDCIKTVVVILFLGHISGFLGIFDWKIWKGSSSWVSSHYEKNQSHWYIFGNITFWTLEFRILLYTAVTTRYFQDGHCKIQGCFGCSMFPLRIHLLRGVWRWWLDILIIPWQGDWIPRVFYVLFGGLELFVRLSTCIFLASQIQDTGVLISTSCHHLTQTLGVISGPQNWFKLNVCIYTHWHVYERKNTNK